MDVVEMPLGNGGEARDLDCTHVGYTPPGPHPSQGSHG
jgi:hypothetical protein